MMETTIEFLVFLLSIPAIFAEIDYCTIAKCPARTHTLCKYNETGPAPHCGTTSSSELSAAEIKAIIFMHMYPDGPSSNMPFDDSLIAEFERSYSHHFRLWDADLAKSAQRWVNQCLEGSDACRNAADFYVVQRVGVKEAHRGESEPSLVTIIQNWYIQDIHAQLSMWGGSFVRGGRVLGYTKMGCGKLTRTVNSLAVLKLVCNYGPA